MCGGAISLLFRAVSTLFVVEKNDHTKILQCVPKSVGAVLFGLIPTYSGSRKLQASYPALFLPLEDPLFFVKTAIAR